LIFAFVGIEVALIPSGEVKIRTHCSPFCLSRAGDHDDHLPDDPTCRTGKLGPDLANHPAAPLAESAADFPCTSAARFFWPERASLHSDCDERYSEFARMIFAFGRDGALPQFSRMCTRAIGHRMSRLLRTQRSRSCCDQRHIRAVGGPF